MDEPSLETYVGLFDASEAEPLVKWRVAYHDYCFKTHLFCSLKRILNELGPKSFLLFTQKDT